MCVHVCVCVGLEICDNCMHYNKEWHCVTSIAFRPITNNYIVPTATPLPPDAITMTFVPPGSKPLGSRTRLLRFFSLFSTLPSAGAAPPRSLLAGTGTAGSSARRRTLETGRGGGVGMACGAIGEEGDRGMGWHAGMHENRLLEAPPLAKYTAILPGSRAQMTILMESQAQITILRGPEHRQQFGVPSIQHASLHRGGRWQY